MNYAKLLEISSFFTWHIFLEVGKTQDMPSEIWQTLGDALIWAGWIAGVVWHGRGSQPTAGWVIILALRRFVWNLAALDTCWLFFCLPFFFKRGTAVESSSDLMRAPLEAWHALQNANSSEVGLSRSYCYQSSTSSHLKKANYAQSVQVYLEPNKPHFLILQMILQVGQLFFS